MQIDKIMESENINEYNRLEELSHSSYEIADGEPDIKGWDIKDKSGAKLAEVKELLFNPETQKVRYIIAGLEPRVFGVEHKKVLIPVGFAELHEKEDEVFLPGITLTKLAAAPDYIKGEVTQETEVLVRDTFREENSAPEVYDEQTFYEHDHYNERSFYGRRFMGRGNTEEGI